MLYSLVWSRKIFWLIRWVIWGWLILDCRRWISLRIMLSQFVERLNILLLKFFISRGMESLLIGGVLARWSIKWLLGCLHSTRKAGLNCLTRLSSVIRTFLTIWVRTWKVCCSCFSRKSLRTAWVQREGHSRSRSMHGLRGWIGRWYTRRR